MGRMILGLAVALAVAACADDQPDRSAPDTTTTEPTTTPAGPTTTSRATTAPEQGGAMSDPPETDPMDTNPVGTSPEHPTPPDATTSGEPWFAGEIDPGLDPFVDLAVTDLAMQLGVDPAEITTASAVLVSWSDTSLGCPMPDMQYAQVLQDGSLIELEHDAAIYRYHSGGARTPFLCETSVRPTIVIGPTGD